METNDSGNEPSDTGHCLSHTVSGDFLMLAQNGNLMRVCEMVQERARIAAEIQQVEQQLLACNHPYALAGLGQWCETRNKDFVTELIQRAEKLEIRKAELRAALQQIDEQLAQEIAGLEWSMTTTFVSLIPATKQRDPVVTLRFAIIDQNLEKSHLEICKVLDSYWRDRELPIGFFPYSWSRDYGVDNFVAAYQHAECRELLHKMFSSRRSKGP